MKRKHKISLKKLPMGSKRLLVLLVLMPIPIVWYILMYAFTLNVLALYFFLGSVLIFYILGKILKRKTKDKNGEVKEEYRHDDIYDDFDDFAF